MYAIAVYKQLDKYVRYLININITLTCKTQENQENKGESKIFHSFF